MGEENDRLQNNEKGLGRWMMQRAIKGLTIALAVMSALAQAEEGPYELGKLYVTDRGQWRDVSAAMSPAQYRLAARRNKHLIKDAVKDYVQGAFSLLGVPRAGMYMTGAAMALVKKGGKLTLNEDRTLFVEVDDVTSDDRSLQLKFKIEW